MRYVNATTAAALLGLALFQLLRLGDHVAALLFVLGAGTAAFAAKHWIQPKVVRLLALLAAAVMFCFFWQFFSLTPALQDDWYRHAGTLNTVGLLFAAFAMIPVVSEYTCRMKANGACERGRRTATARSPILASLRSETSRQTT